MRASTASITFDLINYKLSGSGKAALIKVANPETRQAAEAWVPLSVIKSGQREADGATIRTVTMPYWLASEKNFPHQGLTHTRNPYFNG